MVKNKTTYTGDSYIFHTNGGPYMVKNKTTYTGDSIPYDHMARNQTARLEDRH